jgi:glycosyltransferase involved in cell wall biosynthesis
MKVFHGPINIGGIADTLSLAERNLGVESLSYCLPAKYLGFQSDHLIKDNGYRHLSARIELLKFLLTKAWEFDVFHFYFGQSLTFNQLWDLPLLKSLGKSIFFYFHGCDIRNSKQVISRYDINACKEHWPMECNPFRRKTIENAVKYAKGIFVSTPDLLEFIPESKWLPQPINLNHYSQIRDDREDSDNIGKPIIKIAHAPSNRKIKGTLYLERAIKRLQDDRLPVELMIIENVSHDEALAKLKLADIVIDQLLIGAYGTFAIEMMALGKPVVCYIRDNLRDIYPQDLPIISSTPATIESEIKKLIIYRESWSEIGQKGIEYVNRVHDSRIIAQKTIQAYRGN